MSADAERALRELDEEYFTAFVGRRVLYDGVTGVVVEHDKEARLARYRRDNGGGLGRLPPAKLLVALMAWQTAHGRATPGKRVPEEVNELAATFHRVSQKLKVLLDLVETRRKKRKAQYYALFAKRRKTMGDIGDHSAQLRSFDRQQQYLVETELDEELAAAAISSHDLHDVLKPFVTIAGTVQYFSREFNFNVGRDSLKRRLDRKVQPVIGGVQELPADDENNLAKHVIKMAHRGQILTHEEVRQLAAELKYGDDAIAMLSRIWYKAWLGRVQEAGSALKHVAISSLPSTLVKFYNAAFINWWYDVTATALREIGVVDDGTNGAELNWKYPNRVLILDETRAISRETLQTSNSKMKGPALALTSMPKSGQRKRRVQDKDDESHVTLLAGMNLAGDTAPPLWILSSKDLSQSSRSELEDLLKEHCTSSQLGSFNGQRYTDVKYSSSVSGGMTKANFLENILKVLRTGYPDMGDHDPSKRVVLFMDGHCSRQDLGTMSELARQGVYLHFWLPHARSQCQAPSVNLFGPLKAKLQEIKHKARQELRHGHELDQLTQIHGLCEALKEISVASRAADALRQTGMLPFTRELHLKNPIRDIGDTLYKGLTLPVSGNGLLKYIQDYDPAVTPPPTVPPPVQADAGYAQASSSTSHAISPPTPPAAAPSASSLTRHSIEANSSMESVVNVPISDANSPPAPTLDSATPPVPHLLGGASSLESSSATSGASSLRSPSSAFEPTQSNMRLTRYHMGRTSAFARTATMADVRAKAQDLCTEINRSRAMIRWTLDDIERQRDVRRARAAARYEPEMVDLDRTEMAILIRREAREKLDKVNAAIGTATLEAAKIEAEMRAKIWRLNEQAELLRKEAEAIKRSMEADKIRSAAERRREQMELSRRQTDKEEDIQSALQRKQAEQELAFLNHAKAQLEDVCTRTQLSEDDRKVVAGILEIARARAHSQRDDYSIGVDQIGEAEDVFVEAASFARLRPWSSFQSAAPVHASTGSVSARGRSTSPMFRKTPRHPVPSSRETGASGPRPSSRSSTAQAPGSDLVDPRSIESARARLHAVLSSEKTAIGVIKDAVKGLKKALRAEKNLVWRKCVPVDSLHGAALIDGAWQILKELDQI